MLAAESTTSSQHLTYSPIPNEWDLVLRTEPVGWEDVLDDRGVPFQVAFVDCEQPPACSFVGQSIDNSILLLNRDILKWSGFPGWLSPTSVFITASEGATACWFGVHSIAWQPLTVTASLPYSFLPVLVARLEAPVDLGKPSNQAAIELLKSWYEEDEQEQRETWAFLKHALDEDRLSDRRLF